MSKLRVGLIGCGGRGRQHATGYAASDKVEMVTCADPSPKALGEMSKSFGVSKGYADYREMLEKEKLDVVSICLWIPLHLEATLAAAEAGVKLINAEKPMAPTWGDAVCMYEACEKAGIVMTLSHQRRFAAQFIRARQLAQEGAIGQLQRLEGFCSNLFDWGTHWFDMLFFYNEQEPVEWVMGQIDVAEERTIFGTPIETHGMSYYRCRNGVSGLLVTGDDHGGGCQNRLLGSDGIIEVGGAAPLRVLRLGASDWETIDLTKVVLAGSENATVCYILDSIDAFLDGREPELSSRKALMATELIFATYESARRRARVHLPLEIDDSPLLSMLESGEVAVPDEPARDGSA